MSIEICKDHSGKMEGIQSISTSVLLNKGCQKNRTIIGSICSRCYAENMAKMYSGLEARLARNTETLTKEIIPWDELPDISDQEIFRLEAFGDLNNEIQFINYLHIVQKNPFVNFSLYTKQYKIVFDYFMRIDSESTPPNLTIVCSSLMMNKPLKLELVPGMFREGQIKIFTVYTKEYLKEHPEVEINCGARACNKCRLCYLRNKVMHVSEILKSDRDSTEFMLAMRDPVKCSAILDNIEKIIKDFERR